MILAGILRTVGAILLLIPVSVLGFLAWVLLFSPHTTSVALVMPAALIILAAVVVVPFLFGWGAWVLADRMARRAKGAPPP